MLRNYLCSVDAIAMSPLWSILYILGAVTHAVTASELFLEPPITRNLYSTHCFPMGSLQYTYQSPRRAVTVQTSFGNLKPSVIAGTQEHLLLPT